MKGSKTIEDRRNLLSKLDKIYCVSEFIKKGFWMVLKMILIRLLFCTMGL